MNGFVVFLGLAAANYICQFVLSEPNYSLAFDRTFFQGAAILIYSLNFKVFGNK